jgi:pimeloyl-ACP methyl ester carboxylesterase
MELTPLQRTTLACGPLAYRQTGRGTPLLQNHGWRGSSSHWQNTLDDLADVRTVHAIDLPGHGETPPREDPLTAEFLANLAIDYADQAGLEQFDLVGHSFGAAVAVAIAAHWPRRVRRVVLSSMGTARSDLEQLMLSNAHQWMNLTLPLWRPWLSMARPWPGQWQSWLDWIGTQPEMSRAIAGSFLRQLPDDHEVVSEGVREFLYTDPLSALEVMVDAASPNFSAVLRKITAPVLLLSGDRDPIMPVDGVTALAARLADARTVILEDCGHMPMIEWPDRFHREVRSFLVGDASAG